MFLVRIRTRQTKSLNSTEHLTAAVRIAVVCLLRRPRHLYSTKRNFFPASTLYLNTCGTLFLWPGLRTRQRSAELLQIATKSQKRLNNNFMANPKHERSTASLRADDVLSAFAQFAFPSFPAAPCTYTEPNTAKRGLFHFFRAVFFQPSGRKCLKLYKNKPRGPPTPRGRS